MLLILILGGCSLFREPAPHSPFSPDDQALLDRIEHGCFLYFWNEANPDTGLVRDKTGVEVCSVASQGFALAALPIGVERGFVKYGDAEERALRALRTLHESNAHYKGTFCHFIDMETGRATVGGYESGSSSIDHALLMAGAIAAGEYFGGESKKLAEDLFSRTNWMAHSNPEKKQVYMTWIPETWGQMQGPGKFDPQTWDWYSDETLLVALLGISSPIEEHRLEPEYLTSWVRKKGRFKNYEYIYSWPGTLFTYMFAHCYFDFSRMGPDPHGVDWHFNTAMAVRANRDWCREHRDRFKTYGTDRWGITAGSGPGGRYVVPGHPPRGESGENAEQGTLHPYGAGMSLPFLPGDAMDALRHMKDLEIQGQPVWIDPNKGGYGFMDGFNMDQDWVSDQVIGIAHGPMLLMIENARTGLIHELFMKSEYIKEGIQRAGFSGRQKKPEPSPDDTRYLHTLARDTWNCIARFVDPETGLPWDTSEGPEYSSVTNLGYYVACTAVAYEMGFNSRRDARSRIRRVLDGYDRFEKWKGWSQSWNSTSTFKPSPEDRMVSVLDSGNMVAGFALASQILPELSPHVNRILDKMDWSAIYDPEAGLLYGGYNMGKGEIVRNWHVGDYAGDGRMAAFWAIATGAVPPGSWNNLNRKQEPHFGLSIYHPGWLGGGLFMQVQDGLFLSELGTPAGRSAADFAYAQMLYAKMLDLEAWGWSASWSPDRRYLGYGGLEVPVITPHAAGMAAMYYPAKSAACLRKLEQMGARPPYEEGGRQYQFGFLDSINIETGEVCDLYLPALDQAMLFLSLANLLEDGLVHKHFMSHPTVKKGTRLIGEYTWPSNQAWLAELKRRDREPLQLPESSFAGGASPILVDDFEDDDIIFNRLGGRLSTWTRDPSDDTVSVDVSLEPRIREGKITKCLRIDYDVDSTNPAFCGVTIELAGVNASGCSELAMWIEGVPDNIKTELHGKGGIGVTRLRGVEEEKWNHVAIPFVRFGGMITDWSSLDKIVFVFEDTHSIPKTGRLRIDDLELR